MEYNGFNMTDISLIKNDLFIISGERLDDHLLAPREKG
jgi:hypothetical protein